MAKNDDIRIRNKTRNKNRAARKKRTKTQNIVLYTLLLVFISAFVFSSFKLVQRAVLNKKQIQLSESIKNEVVEEALPESSSEFSKINFETLKGINSDVVAYIEMPGTIISFPVLKGTDNDFYLNKDINKKYNINGSIFMNYVNKENFTDANTVIFGHNMHNGNMFNDLNKLVKGTLGNDLYIRIYTPTMNYKYKVFSTYYYEPVVDPIVTNLENPREFIDGAVQRSNVNFGYIPRTTDKILTLSTCDMSGKKRTIVHAAKVLEEPVIN